MTGERLPGLDALRGIAALSILAYHTIPVATGEWRGNGYLAVDFFFMLSGYVMARTYEARLATGMSPRAFLWARLLRLWPTMFAAGLLALPCFFLAYGTDHVGFAAANLLLIPALGLRWAFPLNTPAWSIFFELAANALHAWILRHLSIPVLLVLASLMVPVLVWAAARLTFDLGSHSLTFGYGLPRVILSYAIGIVLWRWWRDAPTIAVSPDFAFVAMPVFFAAGTWFDGNSWEEGLLFILLVCPMMIAGGLRWRGRSRLAELAGAISFPLYAFHTPIFAIVNASGLHAVADVVLSLACAWLFTRVAARLAAGPDRRMLYAPA